MKCLLFGKVDANTENRERVNAYFERYSPRLKRRAGLGVCVSCRPAVGWGCVGRALTRERRILMPLMKALMPRRTAPIYTYIGNYMYVHVPLKAEQMCWHDHPLRSYVELSKSVRR